jgi:hypothetical protein
VPEHDLLDLDRGLAEVGWAASAAADLADPARIRLRGRRRQRQQRAQVALAVLLVASLVGGAGVLRGLHESSDGGRAVAPAGVVMAPDPVVRVDTATGTVRLSGPAGDKTWAVEVRRKRGVACVRVEDPMVTAPGLRESGLGDCAGQLLPEPDVVAFLDASTDVGTSSDCAGGIIGSETDGTGAYGKLLYGFAAPQAERVRLELLDGRVIEVRPVASDVLDRKVYATWLPECVTVATTAVYGPGDALLSRKPAPGASLAGDQSRAIPGTRAVDVTFGDLSQPQRIELLVSLERAGGEVFWHDGDLYRLTVVIEQHWPGVRDRLDRAQAAGQLTYTTRMS